MEVFQNLDLLSVGVVVAGTVVLGFSAFFTDKKSATNQAFLFFSITTAFWGFFNYAEYQMGPEFGIWFIRFSLFFAVWQAYSLYLFFSVFPNNKNILSFFHRFFLLPIVFITAALTLTSYVLHSVTGISSDGTINAVANGPGIILFGIVAVTLVLYGLVSFFRKLMRSKGKERRPYVEIQVGAFITFSLIITFNFILPAFFENADFVKMGSLFVFPLIVSITYAIFRERLFNVKVATTSILVFVLAIVSFADIVFSDTLLFVAFRSVILALVLIFGVNLIRGVIREVEQREKIQKLAEELEETNERQEGLIHFIGHEVKGFLTKDEGTFAALIEGDLGMLPETARPLVSEALAESRRGVESVTSILKAANLKRGTVTYEKVSLDFKELVAGAVEKARAMAEQKGLNLSFTADEASYQMVGDKVQIGDHVLRNLIDNAINYTLSGSVSVSLKKDGTKFVFAVKDSGVGITDEDKKRLFTEGGHGKDSQKINAHSSGYGLYIAKNIVEAHGGTIRAESAGEGQGSTFVVEFPT